MSDNLNEEVSELKEELGQEQIRGGNYYFTKWYVAYLKVSCQRWQKCSTNCYRLVRRHCYSHHKNGHLQQSLWMSGQSFNSLSRIRLTVDEITSLQSQTEADLREARRRAEEANKQVIKTRKRDRKIPKSALQSTKRELEDIKKEINAMKVDTSAQSALRSAKHELEVDKKEINAMKKDTSTQSALRSQTASYELLKKKQKML
eukprot:TRINITY_DN2440_c0_g1_i3.p2 TRINITY_DN2440_c0_g1~~TRINITY_DN2440_c0_g1_i3.p2  ORF type:complete len:203 (+),score=16.22 TRINITY_DN2440_c0_g1_i3:352-960(+)